MKKILVALTLFGTLSLSAIGQDITVRSLPKQYYEKGLKVEFIYGKLDDVEKRLEFLFKNYYVYELKELTGGILLVLYKED